MSVLATIAVVLLIFALAYQIRHLVATLNTSIAYEAPVSQDTGDASDAQLQQELMLLGLATSSDPGAISESDPISMIGPVVVAQLAGRYAGLVDSGSYSEESGAAAAESIAPHVKAAISYEKYDAADVQTDSETSYERMLGYRSDLREALSPLLKNTESEFEVYGKYIETSDTGYLDQLSNIAVNYRAAAEAAARVTVPRDALNYHLDILNAMALFAATLETMASHPDDPFATVALLRSYNSAEERMFLTFNALSNYYGQKLP